MNTRPSNSSSSKKHEKERAENKGEIKLQEKRERARERRLGKDSYPYPASSMFDPYLSDEADEEYNEKYNAKEERDEEASDGVSLEGEEKPESKSSLKRQRELSPDDESYNEEKRKTAKSSSSGHNESEKPSSSLSSQDSGLVEYVTQAQSAASLIAHKFGVLAPGVTGSFSSPPTHTSEHLASSSNQENSNRPK